MRTPILYWIFSAPEGRKGGRDPQKAPSPSPFAPHAKLSRIYYEREGTILTGGRKTLSAIPLLPCCAVTRSATATRTLCSSGYVEAASCREIQEQPGWSILLPTLKKKKKPRDEPSRRPSQKVQYGQRQVGAGDRAAAGILQKTLESWSAAFVRRNPAAAAGTQKRHRPSAAALERPAVSLDRPAVSVLIIRFFYYSPARKQDSATGPCRGC